VIKVNADGKVLATFSDVVSPRYLAACSNGQVLVADYWNHSVVLLNAQLEKEKQKVLVSTDSEVAPWYPRRLCYDEQTSELRVLHNSGDWWWVHDIVSAFKDR